MPKVQTTIMFEFASDITPDIVANVLDIEKETAQEMCEGTVAFNQEELNQLASYKGVGLKRLIKETR